MIFFGVISFVILWMMFHNRDKKALYYAFFLILLSFMLFNIENPDKENYSRLYNDILDGRFHEKSEIGMQILIYLMTKLQIGFDFFLKLFYLSAMLLFTRFVFRWCKRPTMVLLLYAIYPLFLDIVQIRTMMATMIALNALEYLLEFSRKNIVKYVACILAAGSIHYSAFFFLAFLMSYLSVKSISCLVLGMLGFFAMMQTGILDYIRNTFPFLVKQLFRYVKMSNGISGASLFALILSYVLNLTICFLYCLYLKRTGTEKEDLNGARLLLKINILSICIVPFSLFALEFMRLYRLVMIANYSIMGNLLSYHYESRKHRLIPLGLMGLVCMSCIFSFYRYLYVDHMEDVVQVLFEKNYIWGSALHE